MSHLKHKTSMYIALLYYIDDTGMRWGRLSDVYLHSAKNVTFRALNSLKIKKGDAKRHNQINAALSINARLLTIISISFCLATPQLQY